MVNLPPDIAQSINSAAQELQFARKALERAKTWEERQIAQQHFDACQERMVQASLIVNRGLTREPSYE